MAEVVTKPSADDIRQACAEFDSENKRILEEALRELFGQYPHNTSPAQVLLKVTTLNTLYSTQIPLYSERIPTIFDVVEHIVNLGIDSDLERGDDGLVNRISKMEFPPKAIRYNYSFATKYCSWHNPSAYPIYDSRAYEYLRHLMRHECLDRFPENDWGVYPKFKRMIEGFQERYRLGNFTFKEIDKFLFLQGSMLLDRKKDKETASIDAKPDLVPAPGETGE